MDSKNQKPAAIVSGFTTLFPAVMLCWMVIASCMPALTNPQRLTTIAIWQMEDASTTSSRHLDVGELFSMQIAEVIKKTGHIRVVEREQLAIALEELKIGTTSLVNQSTRLKLGKMIGAQLMVFGTYQVFSEKLRIDLKLVDVETGNILKAVSGSAHNSGMDLWLKTIQDAAADLVQGTPRQITSMTSPTDAIYLANK